MPSNSLRPSRGSAPPAVPESIADKVAAIDKTFALYAGPVAEYLVPEAYRLWVDGHQPRLANLGRYAQGLAVQLPLTPDRDQFIRETTEIIVTGSLHERHAYALEP